MAIKAYNRYPIKSDHGYVGLYFAEYGQIYYQYSDFDSKLKDKLCRQIGSNCILNPGEKLELMVVANGCRFYKEKNNISGVVCLMEDGSIMTSESTGFSGTELVTKASVTFMCPSKIMGKKVLQATQIYIKVYVRTMNQSDNNYGIFIGLGSETRWTDICEKEGGIIAENVLKDDFSRPMVFKEPLNGYVIDYTNISTMMYDSREISEVYVKLNNDVKKYTKVFDKFENYIGRINNLISDPEVVFDASTIPNIVQDKKLFRLCDSVTVGNYSYYIFACMFDPKYTSSSPIKYYNNGEFSYTTDTIIPGFVLLKKLVKSNNYELVKVFYDEPILAKYSGIRDYIHDDKTRTLADVGYAFGSPSILVNNINENYAIYVALPSYGWGPDDEAVTYDLRVLGFRYYDVNNDTISEFISFKNEDSTYKYRCSSTSMRATKSNFITNKNGFICDTCVIFEKRIPLNMDFSNNNGTGRPIIKTACVFTYSVFAYRYSGSYSTSATKIYTRFTDQMINFDFNLSTPVDTYGLTLDDRPSYMYHVYLKSTYFNGFYDMMSDNSFGYTHGANIDPIRKRFTQLTMYDKRSSLTPTKAFVVLCNNYSEISATFYKFVLAGNFGYYDGAFTPLQMVGSASDTDYYYGIVMRYASVTTGSYSSGTAIQKSDCLRRSITPKIYLLRDSSEYTFLIIDYSVVFVTGEDTPTYTLDNYYIAVPIADGSTTREMISRDDNAIYFSTLMKTYYTQRTTPSDSNLPSSITNIKNIINPAHDTNLISVMDQRNLKTNTKYSGYPDFNYAYSIVPIIGFDTTSSDVAKPDSILKILKTKGTIAESAVFESLEEQYDILPYKLNTSVPGGYAPFLEQLGDNKLRVYSLNTDNGLKMYSYAYDRALDDPYVPVPEDPTMNLDTSMFAASNTGKLYFTNGDGIYHAMPSTSSDESREYPTNIENIHWYRVPGESTQRTDESIKSFEYVNGSTTYYEIYLYEEWVIGEPFADVKHYYGIASNLQTWANNMRSMIQQYGGILEYGSENGSSSGSDENAGQ